MRTTIKANHMNARDHNLPLIHIAHTLDLPDVLDVSIAVLKSDGSDGAYMETARDTSLDLCVDGIYRNRDKLPLRPYTGGPAVRVGSLIIAIRTGTYAGMYDVVSIQPVEVPFDGIVSVGARSDLLDIREVRTWKA